MRLVKNKDIDTLLPSATQTYQELSEFFQQDFYIEKPMLRILRNEKKLINFISASKIKTIVIIYKQN